MSGDPLTVRALNRALLARQMLLARKTIPALDAVERLVGMQAQQARPPFVGLWTRLEGFRREDLLGPLQERQVVRATMMRGTLHLMSARDYRTLRATIQPALTAGMRSALRGRAADMDVNAVVAAARHLYEARPQTFTDLRGALSASFPDIDERALGYAVRTHLPLLIVPDSTEWGWRADGCFADAASWLGAAVETQEQPDTLVRRYLSAFGPASVRDFQVWSGLQGMQPIFEQLRSELLTLRDAQGRELFDLPDAPRPSEDVTAPVRFLPDFDNVILSHVDRSRIIAEEYRPRVVTRNLLVLPTFLVDGFVAGTWKITATKRVRSLTLSPFIALRGEVRDALVEEGERLAPFMAPRADRTAVEMPLA